MTDDDELTAIDELHNQAVATVVTSLSHQPEVVKVAFEDTPSLLAGGSRRTEITFTLDKRGTRMRFTVTGELVDP